MYLKEILYNRLGLKLNRAQVKQNDAEKFMYFLIRSAKSCFACCHNF